MKNMLASFVYWLYETGILHNKLQVLSIEETIDLLVHSNKSLVRYGDGEIALVSGKRSATQIEDKKLQQRLLEVLKSNETDLEVAICDIFDGLKAYHRSSQFFWKKHLLAHRKTYKDNCDCARKYCNAFITRCYYLFEDKSQCEYWFSEIRKIWDNKSIVIIEGETAHNGVGNDLFSGASNVERVICPSQNAYAKYHNILDTCCKFDKEKMMLLSLGAAAKPLCYDLYKMGYRIIDIGNLDLEYEWFLAKENRKVALKKHSILGEDANRKAGYFDYWNQIKYIIGEK